MIRNYLRCSTDEQSTTSQRHAAEGWLKMQQGSESVRWYDDAGYQGVDKNRPAFLRLMKDVKPGDTVLCYAVDRMTRDGIVATLNLRSNLRDKGAKLVSITESWIASDDPCSEVVTAVLAWAAEQERRRIKSRQRAGIAAARDANGGKCPWGGRKTGTRIKVTEEKERLVRDLVAGKEQVAVVARTVGLSRKTIYQIIGRKPLHAADELGHIVERSAFLSDPMRNAAAPAGPVKPPSPITFLNTGSHTRPSGVTHARH